MQNKKDLIEQANKLQKELDNLKSLIDKEENIFSNDTYKKVCKKLGEYEYSISDFCHIQEEDREAIFNYTKIKQIERFFNQGWKPNWNNSNEYKYYPYFHGRVFDCSFYDGSVCFAQVAFYKDKQTSDFVGKTFIDIYNKLK